MKVPPVRPQHHRKGTFNRVLGATTAATFTHPPRRPALTVDAPKLPLGR